MADLRIERAAPFSDFEIEAIEGALGRALPRDYRDFVAEYGGAFVGGSIDGSEELPILAFFNADERQGVLAMLIAYPDLQSEGILPIADCALGNLYVLDRDHAVHYLNYYGGRTTAMKVADSFQDFLDRIVISDD